MHNQLKNIDSKELDLPETVFVRDVESKVFQSIVWHCLTQIKEVEPLEGNLFDTLLGREILEGVKGIHVEQDQKKHSVNIRVELNISYGISIPAKAEEIHMKILEDISKLTGLHVGSIHIIFKNLIMPKLKKEQKLEDLLQGRVKTVKSTTDSDYYDESF